MVVAAMTAVGPIPAPVPTPAPTPALARPVGASAPPPPSRATAPVTPVPPVQPALGPKARENLLRADVARGQGAGELTPDEQAVVDALAARDAEVRRHEEAHARVGGQYAGAPSYDYQTGPDGQRYAVGGSVPIDVAPVPDDPEATIAKMEVVKAAALAPAEPSGQDRAVAATADRQRLAAMAELAAQRRDEAGAGAAAETTADGGAAGPSVAQLVAALDAAGRAPTASRLV